MEVSCIYYVKVGIFTHLEQSKIFVLTVNKTGIVRLTVKHELIVIVSFMYYPSNYVQQTSSAVLCLEQCHI
jgi:hypothetical protein